MKQGWQQPWVPVVAGALLLLAALALRVVGEHALVAYRAAAQRHGGEVIDLGRDARPASGQYGHMVRVAGVPQVVQPPRDPQFNVTAPGALRLRRVVEMFQWHQVSGPSGVFYEQDWVDHFVDSTRFRHPAGHLNRHVFPFHGRTFIAGSVRIGGFGLEPSMLAGINGDQPVTPDLKDLPPNLAASFQLHDGALVTSSHLSSPELGDVRVRWVAVPTQMLTVIARADGGRLVPARHTADGVGYQVQLGDRALGDVLPDLPPRPALPWLQRALSLLLAWAGFIAIGRRRQAPVAWLSTLAAAISLTALVTAVMWLRADLVAALLAAALGTGALAVVFWLRRGRAA